MDEQRERARDIIVRRLSLRAHSRAELHKAMEAKQIPRELQDELLDRFGELDLVDDASFAQQWVGSRHRSRALSRRALTQELRHKGIDADLIAQATAVIGADQEYAAASALVAKKLRTMRQLTDLQVRRRRLAGVLARRGFGHDVIAQVLTEALAADDGVADLHRD